MILMEHIVREGHPALRKRAEEVKFPTIRLMTENSARIYWSMLINSQDPEISEKYDLRPGIGLAAPQIDNSKRIFALHITDDDQRSHLVLLLLIQKSLATLSKKPILLLAKVAFQLIAT